jgi:hypothetical protein
MLESGVTTPVFIPAVVANAVCSGYDIQSATKVLSIITEGQSAEMAILERGEIIDGGTLHDLTKFDAEKNTLIKKYPDAIVMSGDRITTITGACEILPHDKIIRKIAKLN